MSACLLHCRTQKLQNAVKCIYRHVNLNLEKKHLSLCATTSWCLIMTHDKLAHKMMPQPMQFFLWHHKHFLTCNHDPNSISKTSEANVCNLDQIATWDVCQLRAIASLSNVSYVQPTNETTAALQVQRHRNTHFSHASSHILMTNLSSHKKSRDAQSVTSN